MLVLQLFSLPLLLTSSVLAHFDLVYPPGREIDEEQMPQFPCGGNNNVSPTRTPWPIIGGSPIQIDNEHTDSNVQVLIAIGNNPGDAFNTVLVPTFQSMGPQDLCIGRDMVTIPEMIGGVRVEDGVNATLQVVTDGHETGGLYNCADITFTSTPLTSEEYDEHCDTSEGVMTRPLNNGATINANGTAVGTDEPLLDSETGHTDHGEGSDSGSGDQSAAARVHVGLGLLSAAFAAALIGLS